MEKLEAAGTEVAFCLPTYAGDGFFEVEFRLKQFVVNLVQMTCSCWKWDMIGVPCCHAFSCILYDSGKPEDYVYLYYSVAMYKLAYKLVIYPMSSEDDWVKTGNETIETPLVGV